MPILPREPDIFPADLLAADALPAGESWWVIYTLARREKDLMRRLRGQNVAHYAPMIRRRLRSPAGRVRQSYVPLFPGYVFLPGGEQQRYQALQTNCVSRCFPVPDTATLVHQLRQIQRLVESDAPLTPESRLSAGMRVRIRSGSLAGLEGVVLERRGQTRLLVTVEFIQHGASVLIDDFLLEQAG